MRPLLFLFAAVLAGCSVFQVSPLASAARAGDREALRSLARAGADLNGPSGVNGWTPLLHAIHKNQTLAVRELLALGADPNASNPAGTTPLMMAAGYGQAELVRLLLQSGADPQLRNHNGQTALDLAKSGVADIDQWTLGHPDAGTVHLLSK